MNTILKIVNIVGARPQFIKLAPLLRAIEEHNKNNADIFIKEILIHTGQHYDYEMSGVFFDELGLKPPDYHLGVGSGTHGFQTGEMIKKTEDVLIDEKPDLVIVYGDTNSTLAAALAAAKLHIPVAHVEAGLRSFNKKMPEEINRILTDHVSDFLFCPTETAVENLRKEGFENIIDNGKLFNYQDELYELLYSGPLVINTGDVMYDAVLMYLDLAERSSRIIEYHSLQSKGYALATIHRAENTNDPKRLKAILEGLEKIVQTGLPVILPLHPRTRKKVEAFELFSGGVKILKPVSYLDMLLLEKNAKIILTDSGGVQKEAFFFSVPCITLRDETEWVETLEMGWNKLAGCDAVRICQSALEATSIIDMGSPFGDGNASRRILHFVLLTNILAKIL